MDLIKGQVHFFSKSKRPRLEIKGAEDKIKTVAFTKAGKGRQAGETHWLAKPTLPANGDWEFRIDLGDKTYDAPNGSDYYCTSLRTLWLQDGQIFSYKPAPQVSPSQSLKIVEFQGSLPTRPLYVYLPRGYKEHPERFYPVIYMHDGQNCFESFASDSFAGSWRADETADFLIGQGRMRECIIIAVSNGAGNRMTEYLPLYTIFKLSPEKLTKIKKNGYKPPDPEYIFGSAHLTLAYYRDEVEPYMKEHYRILTDRENKATCGASMGGLFSTYIAWEHSGFARHHAAMSPSFWITEKEGGKIEMIERMRTGLPRDIRLWLDSGTLSAPGRGNDGMPETIMARDALLQNGYVEGSDFQYYLDEGAIHHESAWAARLPKVFQFLFPLN